MVVCSRCGAKVRIGMWPAELCKGRKSDHGPVIQDKTFQPYFDENIVPGGMEITSARQIDKVVRQNKLFIRNPVSLKDRKEKMMERREQLQRAGVR